MLEYARDSPSHRYTRAHTRTLAHTHTRTTLCRQGSGGSKVTDSLPRSPSSIFSRIYPFLPYSRALFSIPRPGRGAPGRGARLSFQASILRSATRGRGRPEEEEEEEETERAPGRQGARTHTEGRAEGASRAASAEPPRPPGAPLPPHAVLHGELRLPPAVQFRQHAPALHALPTHLPLPPTGKRPPARLVRPPAPRTCGPAPLPTPALGGLRVEPGPRCAPRVMAPAPAGGSCAPTQQRPSTGSPGARAAQGWGP